jgi:hypothetical protein
MQWSYEQLYNYFFSMHKQQLLNASREELYDIFIRMNNRLRYTFTEICDIVLISNIAIRDASAYLLRIR